MQSPSLKPRIQTVDIIRGFAVFGILLVNIPDMVGNGLHFGTRNTGSDALLRLLYDLFVQTKFYTIFSFLFGLSFYLFMDRAEEKGKNARSLFKRRLWILLVIGLIHLILLWFGDILHVYAIAGFFLLLFYKRMPRTLFIWGMVLSSFCTLIVGMTYVLTMYRPELSLSLNFTSVPNLAERWDYAITHVPTNLIALLFEVLGLFLFGLYAGKKQWFEKKERFYSQRVKRAQWISLVISLLLFVPILYAYFTHDVYDSNHVIFYIFLSGKSLAVFYIATWLRVIARFGERPFRSLAAVGRMALTNYLSHTILLFVLLRWIWPDIGAAYWMGTVTAIAIMALQLIASSLWLRSYTMGPVEWLWRAGTYGHFVPLKRDQASTSSHLPM
ncbi:DUF418 domain-containing protein [Paenibacillus aquistagni]|uniref:DUF418 domain-containing protein n=1 Tax=Paenibacillus aquistagni TaxID=1852522 RepID=UPI000B507971|nr:DUF418 domain-containing protein [Paenibacillus aquistagni]